ncbi:MAG: hypothetical protein K9G44_12285 [Melioribacteraceae bacterium]|nr:hypothetical protein [Melioribacteraceae bacterium]
MKKITLLLYILLCGSIYAIGTDSLVISNDRFVKIENILISGNETTKDFVIFREMTFQSGDTVNNEMIKFNKERIYSLGLFNFVRTKLQQKNEKINLIIEVEETWYIWPIPIIDLNGNDFNNISYGLGLSYRNFRGRNETIFGFFTLGFDPQFGISYINPLINEEYDLNLEVSFAYQTEKNKSLEAMELYGGDFNYQRINTFIKIGKRFNQFNNLYIAAGYEQVKAPDDFFPNFTASGTKFDKFGVASLMYVYDSRDLRQLPSNGVFGQIEYAHKGLGSDDVNIGVLNIDFREYRPLYQGVTSRWRIATRNLFGDKLPYYENSVLGYSQYVRGHKQNQRDGNNLILTSVETSFSIVDEFEFSYELPAIPKSLTSARLGVQFSFFYDAGLTYNQGAKVFKQNWDHGFGFGITILVLPFNALRVEYAFNEDKSGEIVFGAGFAF